MNVEHLRIPKERVAPAIGSEGKVKKDIERKADVEIDFDSQSGSVRIEGSQENPLGPLNARDVIKAIGRGFSPEKAFKLFEEEFLLDVVDITRYSGDSKKAKSRLKGRVIGKNGRTRQLIEEYTDTHLSIYGKTVACIGPPDKVRIVREAVQMLLDGAPHSAVYNFLEEERKDEKPLELWK